MSNTISGGISFSGIGSGTDFSAMIDQLLEVESYRLYSLQDTRDVATETYEAFQDLISSVSDAQEALSALNSYEEFLTKIASSSSEATLGVKADANAVDGTHKIEVQQLASNAIWANKGSYADKNTVINTSGTAQEFSYTYAGETRTLSVPAGTTLEGFANMVNQDKANPGVSVSILQVADGYTFQVAGKGSGLENSLEIHPSNLSGLSGAGGTWESAASVDGSAILGGDGSINTYDYTLNMRDASTGATSYNLSMQGDFTNQDLVNEINNTVGTDIASIVDGKLTITGLDSMDVTTTPPGGSASTVTLDVRQESTVNFAGNLTNHTIAGPQTYTFKDDQNNEVVITMTNGHTQKEVLEALHLEGFDYTTTANADGTTSVVMDGITEVPDNFLNTDLNMRGTVAVSTFSMAADDLTATISGPRDYTFEDSYGGFFTIPMDGDHTAEDVLTALADKGYASSGDTAAANMVVAVTGVKDLSALTSQIGTSHTFDTSVNVNMADVSGDVLGTAGVETAYVFTNNAGNAVTIRMDGEHTQADILQRLTDAGYPATVSVANGRQSLTVMGISNVDSLLALDPNQGVVPGVSVEWSEYTALAEPEDTIQSGVVPEVLEFTFIKEDGTKVVIGGPGTPPELTNDMTVDEMLALASSKGITSSIDPTTGILSFDGVTSVQGVPTSLGLNGTLTGSDAWQVQASQNAIFKVDNWPQELTSSTNEVTGVLEGITLSLRDVGTAQFTIAADTDSVKANIQTVLDAINSVLKKVQDLTAITEDVTSSYDDEGQSLANTSGSTLTGNYSVQLFASRFKSEVSSSPPGFQPMDADDIFSGDFISGLAQMGIKVSSDVDDPDFGLFSIAPHGTTESIQALDQAAFDDAIANHLEDVIAFFANDNEGRSSSPNFRYSNHIDGLTEPGTYDISYDVDATGTPQNVYINGVLAAPSENDPNTFTAGSGAGGAGGMAITIDNLTPGTNYTGTVSLQKGKVSQIEDFFAAELKYTEPKLSDPSLGDDNGGLKIAEQGAWSLIEQLDLQIEEESTRLERWEYNERLKFARLDTLLGTYDGQMEMLTQQLAQLS